MSLRRAFVVSVFFTILFASFFVTQKAFALSACECSCVDASTTERILTTPPATGQSFLQKCQADAVCGTRTISNAYAVNVTVGGTEQRRTACECVTPQFSSTFVRQSTGDTSCTATCESSCRGQGFAVNPQIAPRIVQTPCITDNDCKTGVFREFKGVTCMTQRASNGDVTRSCNVPVTGDNGKANANIECANFAGTDMKGATCDFIAAGDSPQSYLISRPYFQVSSSGVLSYTQRFFTGTQYPYAETLWTALDTAGPISLTTPGICYLYGTQQADYSNMDVTRTLTQGATVSRRYVCVKRKISACGTVNVNQTAPTPVVKNSIRYSCMPKSSVSVSQQATHCIPASGTYTSDSGKTVPGTELCSTPNQVCCALGCTLDVECGAYKVCSNGQCVAKTQCNPNNADWRCRTASAAEKANSSICLQSLLNPTCQNASQTCCAPANPASLGSCAADMQNNQDFRAQFGANGWMNFACLTADQLTSASQTMIADWKAGGSCVLGDVASTLSETKTAARCGVSKRCCLAQAVAPAVVTGLQTRPVIGSVNCSPNLQFSNSCVDLASVLNSNVIGRAQYESIESYVQAVISTGACQATPVNSENPLNTKECASTASANGICCYQSLRACNPEATPSTCSATETCHPQLAVCIPSVLLQQQISSQSCADRAFAAGDSSVTSIPGRNGVATNAFTCQIVNTSDTNVDTKCLVKGCSATPDGQSLSAGQAYRCCVPGTGQSPAASAATSGLNSTGGAAAAESPSTIGLSSCITTGQCGLNDILMTAANFANFLFRISGAIFLAIFVYAGFLYLTAGSTDRGKKGLTMIKQSSIGLVLLFSAYILINFIQSSFISTAYNSSTPDRCGSTSETGNMSCTILPLDAADEKGISEWVQTNGCVRNMCNGAKNRVCCPTVKTTN